MKKQIKLTIAALIALIVGCFLAAGTAQAQKVGNPGATSVMAVGGTFKFGTLEPLELDVDPDDPSSTVTLNGSISSSGVFTIPQANTEFPEFTMDGIAVVGTISIKVNTVGDITGSLNPMTGAAFVPVKLWIKINSPSSLIGSGCAVASAGSPIVVDLTTGTSTPTPASAGPALTGVPYDPETGQMTLVDAKLAAPASSGCGLAASTVDDMVGLPSGTGKNQISLVMQTTPIVTRGVQAKITAPSFNTISGADRTMSGATSFTPGGLQSYEWDFNDDGVYDTAPSTNPVTSHVFSGSVGDQKTVRLRVTDNQGDSHVAKKVFTIVAPSDISIDMQEVGAFEVGTNPLYRIQVENLSPQEAPNKVVVTDHVPAEFPVVSASGTGWNCSVSGQDVTCEREPLAGSTQAPPIDVTVGVTGDALPFKENTATVTSPSDPDLSNNSVTLQTHVFAVDLIIKKHHAYEFRPGADPKNVHVIDVTNRGTAPTANPTTITDELPAGLTPLSATGPGWSCNIAGQNVECTNNAVVDPGESLPPVEIASDADIVGAGGEVGDTSALVTNTATVSNIGDVIASNDSDDDPTYIIDTPDLSITKSHVGNFRAGAQATYSITVENRGPQDTATPTVVTDVLPDNMEYVSGTGTGWVCDAVDQTVTCEHQDPIVADTFAGDLTLTVLPTEPAEVVNVAQVANDDDPNPTNNQAEDPTSVRLIDLSITAAADNVFKVNRQGWYRISLENLGSSATASSAVVTSTLPAGVTYSDWSGAGWNCSASAGSSVECVHNDPIAPGTPPADLKIETSLAAGSVPDVTTDFHVETDDDYVATNNDASVTTDVFAQDSSVSLSPSGAFRAGVTRTYNVDVENVGTGADGGGTTASLTLGGGLQYVGSTGTGWSCVDNSPQIDCTYAPSIAAESHAATLGVQVLVQPAARPSVTSSVAVTTAGDRNPSNDSDELVSPVASPDLGVQSSHDGNFRVGTQNRYTLSVTNHGDAATESPATIVDTIPAGLDFVSANGENWACTASLPTVTCTHSGPIAANGAAEPVVLRVMPTTGAIPTVSNSVAVSGGADFNATNDSHSDPTTVDHIDISAQLDGPTGTINVGHDTSYTLKVKNEGTAATIAPVTVTGTLPVGVAPSEAAGNGWNCVISGLNVNCTRSAPLGGGESAPDITIDALVKPSAASSVAFQFSANTVDDIDAGNNDSNTVNTTIEAGPDGEISLEAVIPPEAAKLRVGGEGVYRVFVKNIGGLPTANGSTIEVTMPDGLRPTLSGSNKWPCYVLGQDVSCTYVPAIPAGESAPSFPINFAVESSASDEVSTTVELSVAGDLDNGNNEATDQQDVIRTDLGVSVNQTGTWTRGTEGEFTLGAENVGSSKTVGPSTLTAELPAGVTYKSAAGNGWNCGADELTVSCARDSAIAAGDSSSVTVKVNVGKSAADQASVSAAVSTADDVAEGNDTASKAMTIGDPASVLRVATVKGRQLKLRRNGSAPVSLTCAADATERCAGSVQLKTNPKVKIGKKKRRLSSTAAKFSLAPGQTATVFVKFNARAKNAMSKRKALKVTALISPAETSLAPGKSKLTLKTR